MRRLARLMHEEFWLFLLAAIAAAFIFPEFGRTFLKPLALPAILVQMYVVMLGIAPEQLVGAFTAWRPLLRSLLLIFVLTPLVATTSHWFFPPAVVLGLSVVASMPSGMSSPFFALQFGGDAALAVVTTTLSHLLVPLLAPITVKILAGGVLEIEPFEIFARLVQLVLLPFGLALSTRRWLGTKRTASLYQRVGWTSGFLIIIITWGIVADVTASPIPLGSLAFAVLLYNGLLFFGGYLLGGAEQRTISITAGYRNVTLGMVLSMSVWQDSLVALPSVMWALTQNAYAVFLLFMRRSTLRASPMADS